MHYEYYVYVVASKTKVLYIGVTNNLIRRVVEHRMCMVEGFSKKYNCKRLVYSECYNNIYEAIAREKQLKKWRREKKIKLIESINPEWKDLGKD